MECCVFVLLHPPPSLLRSEMRDQEYNGVLLCGTRTDQYVQARICRVETKRRNVCGQQDFHGM